MTETKTSKPRRKKSLPAANPLLEEAKAYFKESKALLTPPIFRAAYSDRMAWICACMSQLAYDSFESDDQQIQEAFLAKLHSGGFDLVDTFTSKETDTQAFLASNGEFAILAFRGTQKAWRDVQTDIRAGRIRTSSGKIHVGFSQGYSSIAKKIEKSLARIGRIPIYITGHSLGGALATIATQYLEANPRFEFQMAACYTFGSPRVGNADYDPNLKTSIFRIVNTTDIVTVVPLLTMGFVHVGDIRFLDRRDDKFRRGIPVVRRFLAFAIAFSKLVSDHAILEYRRKLEAIARRRALGLFGDSHTPGR